MSVTSPLGSRSMRRSGFSSAKLQNSSRDIGSGCEMRNGGLRRSIVKLMTAVYLQTFYAPLFSQLQHKPDHRTFTIDGGTAPCTFAHGLERIPETHAEVSVRLTLYMNRVVDC